MSKQLTVSDEMFAEIRKASLELGETLKTFTETSLRERLAALRGSKSVGGVRVSEVVWDGQPLPRAFQEQLEYQVKRVLAEQGLLPAVGPGRSLGAGEPASSGEDVGPGSGDAPVEAQGQKTMPVFIGGVRHDIPFRATDSGHLEGSYTDDEGQPHGVTIVGVGGRPAAEVLLDGEREPFDPVEPPTENEKWEIGFTGFKDVGGNRLERLVEVDAQEPMGLPSRLSPRVNKPIDGLLPTDEPTAASVTDEHRSQQVQVGLPVKGEGDLF